MPQFSGAKNPVTAFHRNDDTQLFNSSTCTPSHYAGVGLTQHLMTPLGNYAAAGDGNAFVDGSDTRAFETAVAFQHLEQDTTLQMGGLENQPICEIEEGGEAIKDELNTSDGARREIALDDTSLFDFWPSLK